MAIEFRCTRCKKLLRTADNTAGKHAKCPECGEILLIPAPETPTVAPLADTDASSPPPPPMPPVGGNPFASNEPLQYQAETGNPYQSPGVYAPEPSRTDRNEIRPSRLDMNDVFSRAWAIFKANWMMCVAGLAIVGVCNAVAGMIVYKAYFFITGTPQPEFPHIQNLPPQVAAQIIDDFIAKILPPIFFSGYFANLFFAWTFSGLIVFFLKIARGQNPGIRDLFGGGKYYLPMMVGLLLLNLPGLAQGILSLNSTTNPLISACTIVLLFLNLIFGQCVYLIVDRKMKPIESFKMSATLMKGNKWTLFIVWLFSGLLGGLIVLCTCFLGSIFVGPFLFLMNIVVYLRLTGQPTIDQYR